MSDFQTDQIASKYRKEGFEPEMAAMIEEAFEDINVIKTRIVSELERESERRQSTSFSFNGKRVRASAADYQALSIFLHLTNMPSGNWKKGRKWLGTPNFDSVDLPNVNIAKKFAVAMIEHSQAYTVARLALAAQIEAAKTLDDLKPINLSDDKNWPAKA